MRQQFLCTRVYPMPASPRVLRLPLVLSPVMAGFPSPAESFIEKSLDLNDLIAHPAATFFMHVRGDSMVGAGIFDGDILVVDRAIEARDGMIVVALVDGEFTVKRLQRIRGGVLLVAENPAYPPLRVTGEQECQVWGVVAFNLRTFVPLR